MEQQPTIFDTVKSIPNWVWIAGLVLVGLGTGIIQVSFSVSIGGSPVIWNMWLFFWYWPWNLVPSWAGRNDMYTIFRRPTTKQKAFGGMFKSRPGRYFHIHMSITWKMMADGIAVSIETRFVLDMERGYRRKRRPQMSCGQRKQHYTKLMHNESSIIFSARSPLG